MMQPELSKTFARAWRSLVLLAALTAVYFMIFSFSAQDAATSAVLSGKIARIFADQNAPSFAATDHVIRKLAHASEFALLYLLWHLLLLTAFPHAAKRVHFLLPLALVAVSAGIDEWSQTYSPGRAGRFSDVCIDLAGASAMGLLLLILHRFFRKRETQHQKSGD